MNRLLLLAPRIATNRLWARAGAVASFHIAPARTQNARDLITGSVLGSYNSASPAWAVGPDGVLALPAANAPVIEYDPATLQCLGARIREVLTNQIRNNTMIGAAAGTPGTVPTNYTMPATSNGLSRQIVGTGQSGGIDYIDVRYFGTTTASSSTVIQPEGNTSVTAATGQSWTASSYLFVVGGSTSGINAIQQRIAGRSSAGSLLESATVATASAASLATARFSASMTFANASTARVTNDILLTYNSGAVIDITLRIGLPQLEQSAVMGPVVKTTGTAASSTADVWDITSLTAGINNLKTLYFRGRTSASGTRGIASLNDNTASNRLELSISGTTAKAVAVTSSSTVADLSGGTIAANTTFRLAVRLDADSYALSLNGGAVVTDTSGARALVDRVFIGRDQAGNYMNGYIEEMAGWTKPCADGQLSALAAS